jgi:hypothetical protein
MAPKASKIQRLRARVPLAARQGKHGKHTQPGVRNEAARRRNAGPLFNFALSTNFVG